MVEGKAKMSGTEWQQVAMSSTREDAKEKMILDGGEY
jgi:hypothetical protein